MNDVDFSKGFWMMAINNIHGNQVTYGADNWYYNFIPEEGVIAVFKLKHLFNQ